MIKKVLLSLVLFSIIGSSCLNAMQKNKKRPGKNSVEHRGGGVRKDRGKVVRDRRFGIKKEEIRCPEAIGVGFFTLFGLAAGCYLINIDETQTIEASYKERIALPLCGAACGMIAGIVCTECKKKKNK